MFDGGRNELAAYVSLDQASSHVIEPITRRRTSSEISPERIYGAACCQLGDSQVNCREAFACVEQRERETLAESRLQAAANSMSTLAPSRTTRVEVLLT